MATDVDVQFFSHLNGLVLGNNWGDLIRLLDKALVTGLDFTEITSASINEQGDVIISLYAAHNAMLFQVVELSGFSPVSLNQKYRIKGVPNATQLILKPQNEIGETSVATVGEAKLASLGYETIFRDVNDVKRVYRAKDPSAQHPFIRIDESLSSSTGSYTNTYAKYAMVGLLEHMEHIDDFENPNVLQLPFDSADPAKNWKITGTGTACVRGWSRWHWARNDHPNSGYGNDSSAVGNFNRSFTLCGDSNAFYFLRNFAGSATDTQSKVLAGCGLLEGVLDGDRTNWFLMTWLTSNQANLAYNTSMQGASPFGFDANSSRVFLNKAGALDKSAHVTGLMILPDYRSGYSDIFGATTVAALEVPIYDASKYLRGTLRHAHYSGKNISSIKVTSPYISEYSMYIADSLGTGALGGIYFYLGELE